MPITGTTPEAVKARVLAWLATLSEAQEPSMANFQRSPYRVSRQVIRSRFGTWGQLMAFVGRPRPNARGPITREHAYVAATAQRRPRLCLRCNYSFASEGPHNRICQGCRPTIANLVYEDWGNYRLVSHVAGGEGL